jgi:TatD DNase family protein
VATFVDSHCHLADPQFDADRNEVIERARLAGARALVCIGESLAQAAKAEAIAAEHPGLVWWTAGVHPHDAERYDPVADGEAIRACIARGAVAVGECGLDYHYDHSPRPLQRRAFAEQLTIARDTSRPVVVHSREAVDDSRAMIAEAGAQGIRGVMHCFGGPRELLDTALDAGWYISFAGVVTFKKFDQLDLVAAVPADRLLLETDAPYLAPVPFRGKRNEPAHVAQTLAFVATQRGTTPEALGTLISANAVACFGLV